MGTKENQHEIISDDFFTFKRQYLSEDEIISVVARPESGENPAFRILDAIRGFIDHVNQEKEENLKKAKKSLPRGYKKTLREATEIRAKHMTSEAWDREVKNGKLSEEQYWRKKGHLTDDERKTLKESKMILELLTATHPFSYSRIDWCSKAERIPTENSMNGDVGFLDRHEPRIRELVHSGSLPTEMFYFIFEMGRCWESLRTRLLNKHRKRRRIEQRGAVKAGVNSRKVVSGEIRFFVDEYLRENPGEKKEAAIIAAQEEFRVSRRTIYSQLKKTP